MYVGSVIVGSEESALADDAGHKLYISPLLHMQDMELSFFVSVWRHLDLL